MNEHDLVQPEWRGVAPLASSELHSLSGGAIGPLGAFFLGAGAYLLKTVVDHWDDFKEGFQRGLQWVLRDT